ncbi:class E sortase [Nocardioides sambongensis]|uniref:class E sortase n=1 Tax=Nocardioides sambongensis TaxID=2589074 RepID=UPI001126E8B2|nr:class E sortase [Nocardioides sambongensis]
MPPTDVSTEPDPAAGPPAGPVRRRRPLFYLGIALILVGLAILGWLGWQLWGTNWQSERRHAEVTEAVEKAWTGGEDRASTEFGEATAIVRIPRFGEDYAVPVLEGSSDEVLAAGIGHMEGSADAGAKGNYALAAHRVTHGQPFSEFPELEDGDLVEVQTRTATYTYELDNGGTDLILPFTSTWVLDEQPVNPDGGVQPPEGVGKRLITLVTCSEIFHTDDRSIVFGHLVSVEKTDR